MITHGREYEILSLIDSQKEILDKLESEFNEISKKYGEVKMMKELYRKKCLALTEENEKLRMALRERGVQTW